MESFLICENPGCRMVLDLRENGRVLQRSELILGECPECKSRWSSICPFCRLPLEITWHLGLPQCFSCYRKLAPKTSLLPST